MFSILRLQATGPRETTGPPRHEHVNLRTTGAGYVPKAKYRTHSNILLLIRKLYEIILPVSVPLPLSSRMDVTIVGSAYCALHDGSIVL